MSVEYRGDEIIFAVSVPKSGEDNVLRFFNQTGGSSSKSADEIELDTKDKTGSDYGKITQNVSLEGIMTEGDETIEYVDEAMDNKKFIKIYEINTRTLDAKSGLYMITSFEKEYSNGEYATYTLEGTLNGKRSEETLKKVPEGAPESEEDKGDDDSDGDED